MPTVGENDAPPPAYAAQVAISTPPPPKGVPTWGWVVAAIAALFMLSIPYFGWVISIAVLVGATWLHFALRRRSPSTLYRSPEW